MRTILFLLMLTSIVNAAESSVGIFGSGKISYNAKTKSSIVKYYSKDNNKLLMVMLTDVKESDVKILPDEVLEMNLSKWRPQTFKEKKVIRLYPKLDVKSLSKKKIKIDIAIKADRVSEGVLFGEGMSNGKHYYFEKHICITTDLKVFEIIKFLPKDIEKLWIRLDLFTPATYSINNCSISESDPLVSIDGEIIKEGHNYLTNGSAEWWFYNTHWNNPKHREIDGKVIIYDGKAFSAYKKFSIDNKIKYNGERSFRIEAQPDSFGRIYFAPVPYVPGKKTYLSFYAKAKSNGTKMSGLLFVTNGVAYAGKDVTLTNSWKKYTYEVIWGDENGNGLRSISSRGDMISNHGSLYGVTFPRFTVEEGVVWLDNVKYSIGKPAPDSEKLQELNMKCKINNDDGVYKIGEQIIANATFENVAEKEKNYNIRGEFVDFKGDVVASYDLGALTLKSGTQQDKTFSIIPKKRGSFTLFIKAVERESGHEFAYGINGGVIPDNEKRIKRFAVDVRAARNQDRAIPYLSKFGIGAVRLWSEYRWRLDKFVGLRDVVPFQNAGMFVLLNVGFPDRFLRIPKDMSITVTRWEKDFSGIAKKVDCFEILNEPNIWNNKDPNPEYEDATSTSYVRTLQAAKKLFKRLNPNAKIAGPTTCHTDISFTSAVLAAGGDKYLDVITEHPYRAKPEHPDFDTDIAALRKLCGNRPIYSTECGNRFPAIVRDKKTSKLYKEQLAEIMRMLLIAYGCGNEMYVNFTWNTTPDGIGWELFEGGNPENHGTIRPAPVLYATRDMVDMIGDAPTLGRLMLGRDYRSYIFDKGHKRVVAMWKIDGPDKTIDITNFLRDANAFDMMGNKLDITKIPLYQYPVYVETAKTAEDLRKSFAKVDLKSSNSALSATLKLVDANGVDVNVSNNTNRPLKATVSHGLTQKEIVIAPENVKAVRFNTEKPISDKAQMFSAMISTDDPKSIIKLQGDLKAILADYTDKTLKIDGDISDWPEGEGTLIDYNHDAIKLANWRDSDKKIIAKIRTMWDNDNLYVSVVVYKKDFFPVVNSSYVWEGDGLQLAFDTLSNGIKGAGYMDDDFEYGIALQNKQKSGKAEVYRRHASSATYDSVGKIIGKLDGSEVKAAVKVYPDRQVYELAFGRLSVSPFRLIKGGVMKWSLLVNVSDGKKRIGYLELTPGIGYKKNPHDFIPLLLK